jgi:hypothetical protein
MDKKEAYRNKEFLRFMKWVKENNSLWETICGHNKEEMTMVTFRRVMSELQKESFYIPMYVFLTAYKDVEYVRLSIEQMFIAMFANEWERNESRIFDELYENLK